MDEATRRFCDNPWTYCEIYAGGGVYICCPAWNFNKEVGNIFLHSPEEIWNSAQAQLFRQGILDGSFSQCDREKCPMLVSNSLQTVAAARTSWLGPILSDVIDNNRIIATHGPSVVKIGYDASCNLTCPSCRSDLLVAKKQEQEKLDVLLHQFVLPFLKNAKVLVMSSDGDPFASKHYRDVMKLTHVVLPDLKLGICTNGVLMDARAWAECHLEGRVVRVQVSVDAAEKATYDHVRRGGDFDRLLENLAFLSEKRRTSPNFSALDLLFVVQKTNFREMADFVRLGQRFNADTVQFMLIDLWGRAMTPQEYRAEKIWDRSHPDFAEFAGRLQDSIFRSPIVRLGGVEAILNSHQPPELEINFETGRIKRSVEHVS